LIARLRAWRKPLTAVGLALGILLFARELMLSIAGAGAFKDRLSDQPHLLVIALFFALLVYVAQMIAWQLTLKFLGVDLGMVAIFEGFQLSFLPRYIPGSIWGYVGRSQWLQQVHGVGYSTSAIGSIIEAGLQASTALIVGLACWGLAGSRGTAGINLAIGTLLLILLCLAGPPVIARVSTRLPEGQKPPIRSAAWTGIVLSNLALRFVYGLSFLAIARVVSRLSALDPFAAVGSSNLSWLLGFVIPFVPTGIGIREWALGAMLSQPQMLSTADASLAAVLFRLLIILAELMWLIAGLALFARRWRGQRLVKAQNCQEKQE
jgi:glycosyltransferase 2 family protein